MPGSVIVSGKRTPIGSLSGAFAGMTAGDLGTTAIRAALNAAGISGEQVEYVIMGQVIQAGNGQNPARKASTTPASAALCDNAESEEDHQRWAISGVSRDDLDTSVSATGRPLPGRRAERGAGPVSSATRPAHAHLIELADLAPAAGGLRPRVAGREMCAHPPSPEVAWGAGAASAPLP